MDQTTQQPTKRELAAQKWAQLPRHKQERRLLEGNLPTQWAGKSWDRIPRDVQKALAKLLT